MGVVAGGVLVSSSIMMSFRGRLSVDSTRFFSMSGGLFVTLTCESKLVLLPEEPEIEDFLSCTVSAEKLVRNECGRAPPPPLFTDELAKVRSECLVVLCACVCVCVC